VAILDHLWQFWITRIADSSSFANCFSSDHISLPLSWMAKIQILGGGHRLIYRLIEKSVFFELIDHFIRVSSLPNADWATEAEAAVVTGYHPPPSHPQPLPF